jgi:hypothetical protein
MGGVGPSREAAVGVGAGEYEGGSEGVECVPVPGAGHRVCGPERFDQQLEESREDLEVGADRGPGPVLARETAAQGGPPRTRDEGDGGAVRWGRRGGDSVNDVYYPNPARGLDRKAAIARVHASPEVLPPRLAQRAPKMLWINRNAEFMKMRPFPLIGVVAAGFALPFFLKAAIGR